MTDQPLLDTLDAVRDEAHGSSVPLGQLLEHIQERGYGPLIAVLSAFVILPTGAIPGVPAVIGIVLVLLGGQMIMGWRRPWFPDWIENFDIDCDKLQTSVTKARPWAERLDFFVGPRMAGLATGTAALKGAALCIIFAGLLMIPLGFIPFLPASLGLSCLLLGVGITARDGLLIGAGYTIFLAGAYMGWTSMPGIPG
ncbi:exopolysaccharide biosynthesis protein [Loktanella sp. SALINAS62]|uniref:exopolysaccharide biosynthesis protein n=1 Tax=Loktanella sp. SALINAS62 TaxID=2706124 RepID=UPI001B8C3217|nr:exopolysaccharide biosynthesis protein [Loktanella sp. SALINAS62]MBS1304189.1 exopolysaccharide biosynthesis protein [Loktanella sp. SALINAS62]